jgi:hypothetical protein
VPFSADLEVGFGHEPALKGRFYRASNGSHRSDLFDADGHVNMFSIVNVPQRTLYLYDLHNGWRASQTDVRDRPLSRVSQVVLGKKSRDQWSGLDVYESVRGGYLSVTAPALNFQEVFGLSIKDGRSQILRNISLVEPAAELFSPPPGEPIKRGVLRSSRAGDPGPGK